MAKCCRYDHNNDGNCHVHSSKGVLRQKHVKISDELVTKCGKCGRPMTPFPGLGLVCMSCDGSKR